ncbi:MAG: sugar phosphate isomerase/epimerase [Oscillospiraceae bacterium]|nr:sugar phosphate isomerase/epimerase [Oscillospiraceae bacterium]
MENIKIFAFADEASSAIDGQITAMKRNDLDGLEIRGVDGENIADITKEKALEVRGKLDAAALVTWSIGSPIGKIDIKDDFAPYLEKFKRLLEITEILGAKNIRLFSFFMPDGENADIYENEVFERMQKLVCAAKGTGVTLCHENEKGIFGDTVERCVKLHTAIPELAAVFDPANFVQCGVNTVTAWNALKKHVRYVHIKDVLCEGDIVPAGSGDGNIPYIAGDFVKNGGKFFTVEPHLAVFDGLAGLEKDGKTSEVGKKYVFKDNDEAFDAACVAFKGIIKEM